MTNVSTHRLAAVQSSPVFLDLDRTVDKACRLIEEAARNEASLVVFPEAYLPGYPLWVWYIPAGHTHPLRELYAELHANSVTIPSDAVSRLAQAAADAKVAVAMGMSERNAEASDASLFNTLLLLGPDGSIVGRHRKLVPTGGEWGEQIHLAPTWDRGEPWLSSMRHIAKEGRCFVISCCQAFHKDDIPDRLSFKASYLNSVEGWINPGHSLIADPDGKIVAGPAENVETILYADLQAQQLVGPRWQLDIAGHYSRPDVFELLVHRNPKAPIREITDQESQ